MSRIAFELRPTHWRVFCEVFKRHILLSWKNKFSILQSIAFLFVISTTFRLAIGYVTILPTIGMGILNAITVLALLLSSSTLLHDDMQNRYLEQFIITGVMLEVILFAKWLAHLLILGIPIVLSLPLLSCMLSCENILSFHILMAFILLIANTNTMLIFSNAVCLGYEKSTMMALLSIPLLTPSVIFSILSVENPSYLWIMFAIFCISFPLSMISASLAIKHVIS